MHVFFGKGEIHVLGLGETTYWRRRPQGGGQKTKRTYGEILREKKKRVLKHFAWRNREGGLLTSDEGGVRFPRLHEEGDAGKATAQEGAGLGGSTHF